MDREQVLEKVEEIIFDIILTSYQQLSSRAIDPDLKIKEHMIIEFLGRRGAAKMSDLASVFGTPATTMTSIVNRLVEKGYLKRERSSEDRRVVLVMLSDEGKEFYNQHEAESREREEEIFSCLSDEDLKQLVAIFNKVKNNYSSAEKS